MKAIKITASIIFCLNIMFSIKNKNIHSLLGWSAALILTIGNDREKSKQETDKNILSAYKEIDSFKKAKLKRKKTKKTKK